MLQESKKATLREKYVKHTLTCEGQLSQSLQCLKCGPSKWALPPPPLSNGNCGAHFSDPIFFFLMDAMTLGQTSAETMQANFSVPSLWIGAGSKCIVGEGGWCSPSGRSPPSFSLFSTFPATSSLNLPIE